MKAFTKQGGKKVSAKVYIFIADVLFFLALFVIFFSLTYIEKIRVLFLWKKEKQKADIFKDLSAISSKVLDEESNLISYPNIAFYLSQVSLIVRFHGFDIKRIRVKPLEELPDFPKVGFSKEGFREEFFSLPTDSGLLNLVLSCSDLFGRIYKINHPFKYSYITFKKNLVLRIMVFIVELTSRLSSHLNVEAEEKAESKSLDYNFVKEPELVTQ